MEFNSDGSIKKDSEKIEKSKPTASVFEIVLKWLVDHGYDGLCNKYLGCSCSFGEDYHIMWCLEAHSDCRAAYKRVVYGVEIWTFEKE